MGLRAWLQDAIQAQADVIIETVKSRQRAQVAGSGVTECQPAPAHPCVYEQPPACLRRAKGTLGRHGGLYTDGQSILWRPQMGLGGGG
jgi:hypothetical protein